MQGSNTSYGVTIAYHVENRLNFSLPGKEEAKWVPMDTFIGLILAFSSCFFIGISVIFKKLALKDIQRQGGTRAVDGGFGYLRLPKWWLGITLMAVGELTNFVAYIFAPAILVTPLGVFSIVCTATLSPYFLKERLNAIGKLGCVLVLVGCVIVTLCGPKDREVSTMEELEEQLLNPGFLIYSSLVVGISFILMALVPRFGYKYVMFYITICSSFGSLSVMFCKGVGLAIKQTIIGYNEFTEWTTWVCVLCLIGCLLIETIYMQRALDLFNSSVFMSVNYVMFTSLVIIASSILYTEFAELGWKNIVLTILGFVVNIVALYLLYLDKLDDSITENDQDNCPNPDPATPLMIKNNNIVGKELETTRSSPLSNIHLSPRYFRENKQDSLLNFLNKESLSDRIRSEGPERSPSLSSIGCIDEFSYSSRSNLSENSVMFNPSKECAHTKETTQTNTNPPDPEITERSSQKMCEVPLITQLQSSSLIRSFTPERNDSSSSNAKQAINEDTHPSRPVSESFSDADEITKLV